MKNRKLARLGLLVLSVFDAQLPAEQFGGETKTIVKKGIFTYTPTTE